MDKNDTTQQKKVTNLVTVDYESIKLLPPMERLKWKKAYNQWRSEIRKQEKLEAHRINQKIYCHQNREKIREYNRKYARKNRDKVKKYQKLYKKKRDQEILKFVEENKDRYNKLFKEKVAKNE